MDRVVTNIRNRLSLRRPQEESLNILAELAGQLTLKKNVDLESELAKVKAAYPTCNDFERSFPSFCFALATGVGKTRLMGAFITYLYITKKVKNFFVLAPNLTVYNKLIADLSITTSPKYVFQGIGEFVHNQPRIITGENYNQVCNSLKLFDEVCINVFNISKINSETRGGKAPRLKRLSEYLGDSYFNYLANLDDLVLLMDESHHYRADRGMEVINELNPILGLELTATPQVEKSGGAIKFKNVVYEYSLAKAIRDGFVKEPAVATRRDFDPAQYSAEQLDRIKLEDGIRIHEDTKIALDIYARDNRVRYVKPFVLVVAKDTDHAKKLRELIGSMGFFDGYYADKVMEIHSNQSGSEKDENIAQLLTLEDPGNKIEIVIHVNMLKEGWDVTNLYTIIPLRAAASTTLREQTIGRGLRLPYGRKTGNDKVDKLTIVAHDKFQEIVDAANRPDSIIRLENIIEINPSENNQRQEVVIATSTVQTRLEEQQRKIDVIVDHAVKQKAQVNLDVKKTIIGILPEVNHTVKKAADLTKSEIQQIVVEKFIERLDQDPQQGGLFKAEMIKEVQAAYEVAVQEFVENIIEIPRIMIQQSTEIETGFNDFDLDVQNFNYQPVSEEILVKKLREQEDNQQIIIGKGRIRSDSPERLIVNQLLNYSEIDYDENADLLFKLAGQALNKLKTYLDDEKLLNVVQYHQSEVGKFIYTQMMQHFYCQAPSYERPIVRPFTRIEEHNYSKYSQDGLHDLRETITPTSAIPGKVFSGFKKACHNLYKFDSKTEKDFAIILEQDSAVSKWLRPAQKQFHIYWKNNTKLYYPDFVVETTDVIFLVETKKQADINDEDVKEKAKAALTYCKYATESNLEYGGKPWKYVLIPHNAVLVNMSFATLMQTYEVKKE
jgi:type III restriction enzyme